MVTILQTFRNNVTAVQLAPGASLQLQAASHLLEMSKIHQNQHCASGMTFVNCYIEYKRQIPFAANATYAAVVCQKCSCTTQGAIAWRWQLSQSRRCGCGAAHAVQHMCAMHCESACCCKQGAGFLYDRPVRNDHYMRGQFLCAVHDRVW
jgi:hypothetical protein